MSGDPRREAIRKGWLKLFDKINPTQGNSDNRERLVRAFLDGSYNNAMPGQSSKTAEVNAEELNKWKLEFGITDNSEQLQSLNRLLNKIRSLETSSKKAEGGPSAGSFLLTHEAFFDEERLRASAAILAGAGGQAVLSERDQKNTGRPSAAGSVGRGRQSETQELSAAETPQLVALQEQLDAERVAHEATKAGIQAKIEPYEKSLENLKTEVLGLQSKIAELKEQNLVLEQDKAKLSLVSTEQSARADMKAAELTEQKEINARLTAQLAKKDVEMAAQREEFKKKIETATTSNRTLTEQAESQNTQISSSAAELEKSKALAAQQAQALETLKTQAENKTTEAQGKNAVAKEPLKDKEYLNNLDDRLKKFEAKQELLKAKLNSVDYEIAVSGLKGNNTAELEVNKTSLFKRIEFGELRISVIKEIQQRTLNPAMVVNDDLVTKLTTHKNELQNQNSADPKIAGIDKLLDRLKEEPKAAEVASIVTQTDEKIAEPAAEPIVSIGDEPTNKPAPTPVSTEIKEALSTASATFTAVDTVNAVAAAISGKEWRNSTDPALQDKEIYALYDKNSNTVENTADNPPEPRQFIIDKTDANNVTIHAKLRAVDPDMAQKMIDRRLAEKEENKDKPVYISGLCSENYSPENNTKGIETCKQFLDICATKKLKVVFDEATLKMLKTLKPELTTIIDNQSQPNRLTPKGP